MTCNSSNVEMVDAHREDKQRSSTRPIRILHVLGGMDRGGVETWLMHVLRKIDRNRFQMDFLVHTDRRCAYDDELESLGSRLFYCHKPSNPVQYAFNFRRILRRRGPYDIVHSHVHHFSGFVLGLSSKLGVSRRIAHSHTAPPAPISSHPLRRRIYLKVTQRLIRRYATHAVGVSSVAASNLFGSDPVLTSLVSIIYCGIDLKAFEHNVSREVIRGEFGFGSHDFVIGHVGRFISEKNHSFLLRVHAEMLKTNPRTKLLLIGKGPLENEVRALAEHLGTTSNVIFAGVRTDIPTLMMAGMDVLVLPSLHEGLPLVAIEAQAAGLRLFLSDRVTAEADCGCGLVSFMPLERTAVDWASKILQAGDAKELPPKCQLSYLSYLACSPFNIDFSIKRLCEMYSNTSELEARA